MNDNIDTRLEVLLAKIAGDETATLENFTPPVEISRIEMLLGEIAERLNNMDAGASPSGGGDSNVFLVHVEDDICDKTYNEICEAIDAGAIIVMTSANDDRGVDFAYIAYTAIYDGFDDIDETPVVHYVVGDIRNVIYVTTDPDDYPVKQVQPE